MATIPEKMRALQIHSQGGLEVLAIHEIPVPEPSENELLIKVEYSGVNYIDTYQRGGLYPLKMPHVLGNEPAGTIVKLGSALEGKDLKLGDRIAAYSPGGAFAEYAKVPRAKAYKVADGVTSRQAAASALQGLTGMFLFILSSRGPALN
jgi:NADPH2:quinone reductase